LSAPTVTSADREDAALRTLVPKIVATWGTMDISKVAPYYAADADLAYFDIVPLKYNNWKEYSEGVQKYLFEPNRSINAKLNDDLAVHRYGPRSAQKAGSSCTNTFPRLSAAPNPSVRK
jgi:hypothetical protein